jgi:hypothetical protein
MSGGGQGAGRRCIVHIGLNKTGTTTIQGWLAQNVAALEAQGIHYNALEGLPRSRMNHAVGLASIAARQGGRLRPAERTLERLGVTDAAAQLQDIDGFTEALEDWLASAGAGTYVLSSEFLPSWLPRPDWIKAFDTWLCQRFDEVRYIVYLRDQVDWVPSAYGQHVKAGGTITLEEFITQRGTRDYHDTCRKWRRAVGRERLGVRLLEPDFLRNGDLVQDFARVIGADPAATEPPRVLNESLGVGTIDSILKLNRLVEKMPGNWTPDLRASRLAELILRGNGDKLRLTPEQAQNVARRNAGTNERLRRQFFKGRPVLFPKAHRILAGTGADAAPIETSRPGHVPARGTR